MTIRLSLPPHGERLIYDLTRFGLPEAPYVAAQNLPYTFPALPTHIHKGRMEINYFLKGERVYRTGGKDYHLRGGQVFVTWPDEVHGSGSALHGRGLHFWVQLLLPRPGAPFLGFNPKRTAPLLEGLWNLPRRHFRADPAMRGLYVSILDICRRGPAPRASLELSVLLARWLLLVVECASSPWQDEVAPDIAKVLELVRKNPLEHYSVADLADVACLSESRFKGKFREQIGVPPGDYLLRLRTEMAADRLTAGHRNITEMALDLGFSSSQHFSTTFKRFFGKSPAIWAREHGLEERLAREPSTAKDEYDKDGLRPWLDAKGNLHGYIPKDASP